MAEAEACATMCPYRIRYLVSFAFARPSSFDYHILPNDHMQETMAKTCFGFRSEQSKLYFYTSE